MANRDGGSWQWAAVPNRGVIPVWVPDEAEQYDPVAEMRAEQLRREQWEFARTYGDGGPIELPLTSGPAPSVERGDPGRSFLASIFGKGR